MGKFSENTIPFTKETLAALPFPAVGERWYHDAACLGLVLRVRAKGTRPSGDKTFYLNARIDGAATKRWIAPFESVSVSQARAMAAEKRQDVINDRADEIARAEAAKAAAEAAALAGESVESMGETLQAAFDRFMVAREAAVQRKALRARTFKDNRLAFNKYLAPVGATPIAKIDTKWVRAIFDRITNVDNHPIMANRLRALLSAFFNFLYPDDRSKNPCLGVKRNPEKSRDVFLSDDELGQFLAAIDEYERETPPERAAMPTDPKERAERIAEAQRNRRDAADIFRLLAYTGQRSGNVCGMRWSGVDFKTGHWTINADESKSKKKHVTKIPLVGLALLKARQPDPVKRVGRVFATPTGTTYRKELRWAWKRVLKIAQLDKGDKKFRPHDLRATFATGMHNDNEDILTISKTLGHSSIAVTEIYRRGDALKVVAPAVDRRAKRMMQMAKSGRKALKEAAAA